MNWNVKTKTIRDFRTFCSFLWILWTKGALTEKWWVISLCNTEITVVQRLLCVGLWRQRTKREWHILCTIHVAFVNDNIIMALFYTQLVRVCEATNTTCHIEKCSLTMRSPCTNFHNELGNCYDDGDEQISPFKLFVTSLAAVSAVVTDEETL